MARSGVGSPSPNIMILAVHITGGPLSPAAPDRNDFQNARLRGGAGRTRTNHQSVMEHGSSPTNSPGRTLLPVIWVSAETTIDATICAPLSSAVNFRFPETEKRRCGDSVRNRIRYGRPTFRQTLDLFWLYRGPHARMCD